MAGAATRARSAATVLRHLDTSAPRKVELSSASLGAYSCAAWAVSYIGRQIALPLRVSCFIKVRMIRSLLFFAALAAMTGCAMSHDVGGETTSGAFPLSVDSDCRRQQADSVSGLPELLSCTGLYSDTAAREVAPDVRPYAPALKLWSDGLDKSRYIFLPKGTKIDATEPSAWKFPIGTRLWKEFLEPGSDIPVETRIYYKKDEGEWKQSTYAWNASRTDATRVLRGKDVTLTSGQTHWLPGPNDCDECHKGRRDRVLGFEQIGLGLPEASGETLAKLAEEGWLSNFDGTTEYHIGPDDSSADAKALGWMHMNCGVTCHNDTPTGGGMSLDMRLRLKPEELDGRPTSTFPAVATTVGASTEVIRWSGRTRVVAGSPEDSWLFSLISTRNVDQDQQMPPIATYLVDSEAVEWVRQWIEGLEAR